MDRATAPGAPGRRRAALVLVLAGLLVAPGCRRKAPGPEECRSYAYRVAGVSRLGDLERSQALREEVDQITRDCLVTPYDRELLRCVEESGRLRSCYAGFRLRRAGK